MCGVYSGLFFPLSTFAPKDYVVDNAYNGECKIFDIHQVNDSTFNMLTTKNDKMPTYPSNFCVVEFVDADTKELLPYSGVMALKSQKTSLEKSDIEYVPIGYKLVGNSFKIVDNGTRKATITVKKGNEDSKLDLVFFVNSNGALSKFKTVTIVADQYDANKDGVVALDELASAIPDGYVIDEDMQIESAPAVSYMDGFQ